MYDIAIRVENLSKQYPSTLRQSSGQAALRTGPQARYKTIRESIADFGFRICNFEIRNSLGCTCAWPCGIGPFYRV